MTNTTAVNLSNQINFSYGFQQEDALEETSNNFVSNREEEDKKEASISKLLVIELSESQASVLSKEKSSIVSITSLPSSVFFVENHLENVKLPQPIFSNLKVKKNNNQSRISLLSGYSIWNMGYGNTKPERDQFEKNIASYHTGLNYIHPLKKNFSIMVGLQYQQLNSQLDWNITLDDYKITLTDTIVEIVNNITTGTQTEVRGDIDFFVPAQRNVRHFNKTRLLQIPFAVGKTWQIRKWQADILLGGSLNIISRNEGRTVYQDGLQNYNGSSTDFLNNQMKLNGMLSGRLTYLLNSHVGITTGVQFQKGISNWSKEQDVTMRPNIFNLEMGVTYSFGN